MIMFLYGQDTYRSRQKLNGIIEQYKKIHKSGLNLKFFDGEKIDFQDFKDEIQSISMFEEKKLMVLEDSFSNLDFKEKFLKDSKRFLNSKPSTRAELGAGLVPHRNEVSGARNIILFYEQNKILGNDPLFKFLEKNAKSQEFKFLEGQQLKNWAKKEFEKYQCRIGEIALEKLIEFVGNDLWRFSNEISKLVAFKSEIVKEDKSSSPPFAAALVKEEDVELLVKSKIETDIFRTIDFIAAKDKKKALELVKKHLEKGEHPLYLLSMINYQFRNLLMIKDLIEKNVPYYLIAEKTHLKPFVVGKTFQLANKFTFPELKKIYQKIFQADFDIKTGRIQPDIALDLLITEI